MERDYHPLPIRELGAGAGFRRPTQLQAARVALESPALEVMTDLTRASPATIRPQAPLAGANQFMITRGVRLLLVVDDHEKVLGVITATDLLGERPMQVATERGLRRDELTVADVMTEAAQVDVLALADVEARARRPRARDAAPLRAAARTRGRRRRPGARHLFRLADRAAARRARCPPAARSRARSPQIEAAIR